MRPTDSSRIGKPAPRRQQLHEPEGVRLAEMGSYFLGLVSENVPGRQSTTREKSYNGGELLRAELVYC